MLEDIEVWSARRSGATRHAADPRTPAEHDYARIVHSGSFRRLQGKTQILSLGDDDFYRTRLTHSLEVAQVAEGILQHLGQSADPELRRLLPDSALIRALGLAHDIGHPPFGHGGEVALNYCMRDAGGFEGNAQTLRLMATLEPCTEHFGADLTRRTLLGLVKYPSLYSDARSHDLFPTLLSSPTTIQLIDAKRAKPVKACYDCEADVLAWILAPLSEADFVRFRLLDLQDDRHARTRHKSLDCSIMDAADDVAYGIHDLEDAAALGLIEPQDFREFATPELCEELLEGCRARPLEGFDGTYDGLVQGLFGNSGLRKRLIGRLVHLCISATQIASDEAFEHPLLRYRVVMAPGPRRLLDALQKLISERVISGARVQHLDFKGQRMVLACFEALMSSPERLLPKGTLAAWKSSDNDLRIVSDYLACLTDGGLLKLYDRLFSPRMGSIFEPV